MVTVDYISPTVIETLTHLARKSLFSPPHLCLTPLAEGADSFTFANTFYKWKRRCLHRNNANSVQASCGVVSDSWTFLTTCPSFFCYDRMITWKLRDDISNGSRDINRKNNIPSILHCVNDKHKAIEFNEFNTWRRLRCLLMMVHVNQNQHVKTLLSYQQHQTKPRSAPATGRNSSLWRPAIFDLWCSGLYRSQISTSTKLNMCHSQTTHCKSLLAYPVMDL